MRGSHEVDFTSSHTKGETVDFRSHRVDIASLWFESERKARCIAANLMMVHLGTSELYHLQLHRRLL